MKNNKIIYCKNCKWYKRFPYEHSINENFINGKKSDIPMGLLCNDDGIKCCKHAVCFKCKDKITPIRFEKQSIRISGEGILNKNNNCKYYKRKWWKIWV